MALSIVRDPRASRLHGVIQSPRSRQTLASLQLWPSVSRGNPRCASSTRARPRFSATRVLPSRTNRRRSLPLHLTESRRRPGTWPCRSLVSAWVREPATSFSTLGSHPAAPRTSSSARSPKTLAAIVHGDAEHLSLGNTRVVRDFCHARDFARAATMLALGHVPGDYVCASSEGHSVLEVAQIACALAGVEADRTLRFDPHLVRPNDIRSLIGDAAKLRTLGWHPSIDFRGLVHEVLKHDLATHERSRS
jgi:hypothetical protein